MACTPPWRIVPGGVTIAVRVAPRASRNAIAGIAHDGDGRPVLQVRIQAPPVDGAANAALIELLARTLQVRKGDVILQSGETGRTKLIHVRGPGEMLADRLGSACLNNRGR